MRGMRWLLLVAIAAILGGMVYQYRAQKKLLAGNAPPTPATLSTGLSASAEHWHYRDTDLKTGRIRSDIDAEGFQQVKDASRVDLTNVTMKIYAKDGKTYDLVKSAAAAFNTEAKSLYSQGDVEITARSGPALTENVAARADAAGSNPNAAHNANSRNERIRRRTTPVPLRIAATSAAHE